MCNRKASHSCGVLEVPGVSCNDRNMSDTSGARDLSGVPQWDTADRMRKALRESGVGVQEMADYLGVARNTVSTWINGRIDPSTQTLRLWALRCGVDFGWFTGDMTMPRPSIRASGLPHLDSNQEPAGLCSIADQDAVVIPIDTPRKNPNITHEGDRRRKTTRRVTPRPFSPFMPHIVTAR